MSEKDEKTTTGLPWFVYIFIGVMSYYGFKYGIPILLSIDGENSNKLTDLFATIAPVSAIIFLLLAADKLYKNVPSAPDQQQENIEEKDE